MLELNIFDTVGGLPVHVLVVHFAVVLLPIACLALLAEAVRPSWRRRYGLVTFVGLTAGVGAAVVSKLSGEQLATHVGLPATHAAWANVTVTVSALLWLVSGIHLWLTRPRKDVSPQRWSTRIAGWATTVLALATLGATLVVGHSGAQAAWGGRIPSATATADRAPEGTATATEGPSGSPTETSYTMADVVAHNSASSCWAAIEGSVYDLTGWINQHPGGSGHILPLCGTDGTSAFEAQHAGDRRPADELATFRIGTLG